MLESHKTRQILTIIRSTLSFVAASKLSICRNTVGWGNKVVTARVWVRRMGGGGERQERHLNTKIPIEVIRRDLPCLAAGLASFFSSSSEDLLLTERFLRASVNAVFLISLDTTVMWRKRRVRIRTERRAKKKKPGGWRDKYMTDTKNRTKTYEFLQAPVAAFA